MNSKLVIFIFALIGVQTINSSVLKNQLVNSENWFEVNEVNYINEDAVYANFDIDTLEIKEFTLNKSDTVVIEGKKTPQVMCLPKYFKNEKPNNLCEVGNGRYQAILVECINKKYGTGDMPRFDCKLISKVTNKNVIPNVTSLTCNGKIFYGEPAEKNCKFEYSFQDLEFDERDDVLNDEI